MKNKQYQLEICYTYVYSQIKGPGGGDIVKRSNIIMSVAKIMDEIRGMNYPDFVYCICSK